MENLTGEENLGQLELTMYYTPHTTSADADAVGRELCDFQPFVYIPEEPGRSENEISELYSYYKELISGKRQIDKNRPNYDFHKRLIEILQTYSLKNLLVVFFLERHTEPFPQNLRDMHKKELKYKELADQLFDSGNLTKVLIIYIKVLFYNQK